MVVGEEEVRAPLPPSLRKGDGGPCGTYLLCVVVVILVVIDNIIVVVILVRVVVVPLVLLILNLAFLIPLPPPLPSG